MQNLFMVIDNGGTNTKVVLVDTQGKQIAVNSFSTPRLEPMKNFREVNMDQMWENIVKSIRLILKENGIKSEQIIGISTVGHGKGLYLIDQAGAPVRNGILSTDERALEIVNELKLKTRVPTMQPILTSQAPTLLRWLKENEPVSYRNVAHVLSAKDYIRFKLTDAIHTDFTDASSNNVMDIVAKVYDPHIFEFFDIEEMFSKMPAIINSTSVAGRVSKETAELTGLVKGTPVITGMFDIDASALATHVLDPNYISVTAGTWSINEYLSASPVDYNDDILNSIFVDENYYLIESSSATSSGNLDIILDLFLDGNINPNSKELGNKYQIINELLEKTNSQTTEIIYLPFLYGSNAHPKAKGSFIGMDSSVNFTQMMRAVFEGVAFSHRYHLEKLLEHKLTETKGIRVAGGIVNSSIWVQILADVLGYPVEIFNANELGALGGAIATSVGLGLSKSLEEACHKMTQIQKQFIPNKDEFDSYEAKYTLYKKIVTQLNEIW